MTRPDGHGAAENEPTTDAIPTSGTTTVLPARHRIPRFIRTFALPIILGWIVIIALGNVLVPQLEEACFHLQGVRG